MQLIGIRGPQLGMSMGQSPIAAVKLECIRDPQLGLRFGPVVHCGGEGGGHPRLVRGEQGISEEHSGDAFAKLPSWVRGLCVGLGLLPFLGALLDRRRLVADHPRR